jgi:hypothetical protein
MRRFALLAVLALAGCGGSDPPGARPAAAPTAAPVEPVVDAPCRPARVQHEPYPGGDRRLDLIPWMRGEPRELGLVGVLWYWNDEHWGKAKKAWIFTGGEAPEGYSAKVLWAFLSPAVKNRGGGELVIEGRNLSRAGRFRDTFAAIGYEGQNGAPSYASIIDLPTPGCWRLTLTTGDLRAHVDVQARRLAPG